MTINNKLTDVMRDIYKKKEHILSKYIKDISLVYETPHDWALNLIIQFQHDADIRQCEVISVNDMVFCFGPIQWIPKIVEPDNDKPHNYKFTISQTYAVFKKDEVPQSK